MVSCERQLERGMGSPGRVLWWKVGDADAWAPKRLSKPSVGGEAVGASSKIMERKVDPEMK